MRIVGIMPCRNEDWVLGMSARVALMWCDALVILLHNCVDSSMEIACQVVHDTGRTALLVKDEPVWNEMDHRQELLESARRLEATHIAIIDADEILTGNLTMAPRGEQSAIRNSICALQRGMILELPGYNLRGGLDQYHADGLWGNRWFSTVFADHPSLHWTGDRFHHREPMGLHLKSYRPYRQGWGGTMHLWGASERRLRAKHALYKVTERLRWPEKSSGEIDAVYDMWRHPEYCRAYGDTSKAWTYRQCPYEWLAPYKDLMKYLHVYGVPWQECEVKRLVAEHGAEQFRSLDLFGIV